MTTADGIAFVVAQLGVQMMQMDAAIKERDTVIQQLQAKLAECEAKRFEQVVGERLDAIGDPAGEH